MGRGWLCVVLTAALVAAASTVATEDMDAQAVDNDTIMKLMQQVRDLRERNRVLSESLKQVKTRCRGRGDGVGGSGEGWEGVGDVSLEEPAARNRTTPSRNGGGSPGTDLRGPDYDIAMDIREFYLLTLAERNHTEALEEAEAALSPDGDYCKWESCFVCDKEKRIVWARHGLRRWMRLLEPPEDFARLPHVTKLKIKCVGRGGCGKGFPDKLSHRLHEMKSLRSLVTRGWPDTLRRVPASLEKVFAVRPYGSENARSFKWEEATNLKSLKINLSRGVCRHLMKEMHKAPALKDFSCSDNRAEVMLPTAFPKTLSRFRLRARRVVSPPGHGGPSFADAPSLISFSISARGVMRGLFRGLEGRPCNLSVDFKGDTKPPGFDGKMPWEVGSYIETKSFEWLNAPGAFKTAVVPTMNSTDFSIIMPNLGLTEFPWERFRGSPNFVEADLHMNNLTVFPDVVATMPKLARLNLASNRIEQHPTRQVREFFRDNNIVVDLEGNNLPLFNSTSIADAPHDVVVKLVLLDLKAMNTSVPTPDPGVEHYCKSKVFHCHHRRVTVIDFSDLGLYKLPSSMAYLGKQVKSVRLAGNYLESIPDDGFKTMTNIEKVTLRRNRFTSIPKAVLNLPKLETLNMELNRVEAIPEDIDQTPMCESITRLQMSRNLVSSIPNSFVHCRKLEDVSFAMNKLERLPADFSSLRSLKSLELNDNLIQSEALATVVIGPSLSFLDISYNKLTRVPVIEQQGAFGVENILLGANEISIFDEAAVEALRQITRLDTLDLSYNRLTAVPVALFRGSMAKLLLSYNQIAELPPNAFVIRTHISVLSLSHNKLTEIPAPTIEKHSAETEWEISMNESIMIHLEYNEGLRKIHPKFASQFETQGLSVTMVLMGNPLLDMGTVVLPVGWTVMLDHLQLAYFTPPGLDPMGPELVRSIQELDDGSGILDAPGMRSRLNAIGRGGSVESVEFAGEILLHQTFKWPDNKMPLLKECTSYDMRAAGVRIVVVRCLCVTKFYAPIGMPHQCRQCPNLATCEKATAKCPPGTFMERLNNGEDQFTPDIRCSQCPQGGACADGVEAIPTRGYWSNSTVTGRIMACPNKEACEGGQDSECAQGYHGVLCGECERGYYSAGAHKCVECPDPILSMVMFALGIVALIGLSVFGFFMAASILGDMKSKKNKRSDRFATYSSLLGKSQLKSLSGTFASAKQVISFLQIITTLDVTFDIEWPNMMGLLDDVFGWVNLDVMRSTSLECIWEEISEYVSAPSSTDEVAEGTIESSGFGYPQRVLVTSLIPAATTLLLFLVNVLYKCLRRSVLRSKFVNEAEVHRLCVQCHLLVWQLAYLPISYLAIQYFHCRTFDGGQSYYIANDLSTRCYDQRYWTYSGAAAAVLLLYTFGMPMFVLYIGLRQMWRIKKGAEDRSGAATATLYRAYKKEYLYWEALEMLRKVVIGGFVVLLNGSPIFQLTVALGVLFFFTVAYCRCWPNASATTNRVQALILMLTYGTMALGLLRTLSVPPVQSQIFTVTIIAVDILVVAGVMCMVGYDSANAASDRVSAWSASIKKSQALLLKKAKSRAAAIGGAGM